MEPTNAECREFLQKRYFLLDQSAFAPSSGPLDAVRARIYRAHTLLGTAADLEALCKPTLTTTM